MGMRPVMAGSAQAYNEPLVFLERSRPASDVVVVIGGFAATDAGRFHLVRKETFASHQSFNPGTGRSGAHVALIALALGVGGLQSSG